MEKKPQNVSIHVYECKRKSKNTHAAGENINEALLAVPGRKQDTCLISVCISQDVQMNVKMKHN